jgi:hypothetical protein
MNANATLNLTLRVNPTQKEPTTRQGLALRIDLGRQRVIDGDAAPIDVAEALNALQSHTPASLVITGANEITACWIFSTPVPSIQYEQLATALTHAGLAQGGLALGKWRALLKERGAFHGQAAATVREGI